MFLHDFVEATNLMFSFKPDASNITTIKQREFLNFTEKTMIKTELSFSVLPLKLLTFTEHQSQTEMSEKRAKY